MGGGDLITDLIEGSVVGDVAAGSVGVGNDDSMVPRRLLLQPLADQSEHFARDTSQGDVVQHQQAEAQIHRFGIGEFVLGAGGGAGFDAAALAPAIDAFAHPAQEVQAKPLPGDDASKWLFARHVSSDARGPIVATYVRPTGDPAADADARGAILSADPAAAITGFDAIDRALRGALAKDLVLVGGVALVVVAIAMRIALRSARHALVALATLACEMGVVGLAMHALSVRWHVYDALVLPVLFGVTVDESMFLLHAARDRSMSEALRAQGPLVAATALTTAAGFAALVACRFDGLRDVGAIGVLAGLAAALVVVPAAARVIAP